MPKKKTSVCIDDKLWRNFKVLAVKRDKEISELLEEAIRKFLRMSEKERKKQ